MNNKHVYFWKIMSILMLVNLASKSFDGVTVGLTHKEYIRNYKVTGISNCRFKFGRRT